MQHEEIQALAIEYGYQQQHKEPLNIGRPHRFAVGPTSKDVLRWHLDSRGGLIELFRQSWHRNSAVDGDGIVRQAYISTTQPDVVKGWHLHAHQTDRFVCIRGRVLLATYDLKGVSSAVSCQVLEPKRGASCVSVPPGVAHGWIALGGEESWILNLCSHEYDGTDEWRRDPDIGPIDEIPFDWRLRRDG